MSEKNEAANMAKEDLVYFSRKKLEGIFQFVKQHERDGLNALHPTIAIQEQSGYLLGFAQCWIMLHDLLIGKEKEIKWGTLHVERRVEGC